MFMFTVTDTLPPDRLRERGESQAHNETRSSVSLSCRLAVATSQEVFEVTWDCRWSPCERQTGVLRRSSRCAEENRARRSHGLYRSTWPDSKDTFCCKLLDNACFFTTSLTAFKWTASFYYNRLHIRHLPPIMCFTYCTIRTGLNSRSILYSLSPI